MSARSKIDWSRDWIGSDRLRDWARSEGEKHRLFLDRKQVVSTHLDEIQRSDRDESPAARIYFVQEGGTDAIKIGTSKHVRGRMIALGSASPHALTVLATMEGSHRVEALLHFLFSHARIRGEWFRPVPELTEYIEEQKGRS